MSSDITTISVFPKISLKADFIEFKTFPPTENRPDELLLAFFNFDYVNHGLLIDRQTLNSLRSLNRGDTCDIEIGIAKNSFFYRLVLQNYTLAKKPQDKAL